MQAVRRCRAAVKFGNVAWLRAVCPVNWPIIDIRNMLYLSCTFYLPCPALPCPNPARTCIVRTVTFPQPKNEDNAHCSQHHLQHHVEPGLVRQTQNQDRTRCLCPNL